MADSDKHSSLLQYGIDYGCKKFLNTGLFCFSVGEAAR
jgi:hypothetical protein